MKLHVTSNNTGEIKEVISIKWKIVSQENGNIHFFASHYAKEPIFIAKKITNVEINENSNRLFVKINEVDLKNITINYNDAVDKIADKINNGIYWEDAIQEVEKEMGDLDRVKLHEEFERIYGYSVSEYMVP